ncbi:diguanylate cyclase [Novosphingobium sp.]|uniref:diguanylate cyclase domain-containing protein n=1 Tax=Novosphingobium sp. TaxID=1874826 RepID=UPI0025F88A3E|nr:diguanylate cyclase [Novosphingobium sp.]MCC6924940.1 diguanylate cyclase [Novosphingobium sp.]
MGAKFIASVKVWTRRFRQWWRPLLTAVILCCAVIVLGPSDGLDRRFSDRFLVAQALPADPQILIVEVDPADIRQFGGPPFNRDALARVLERLEADGARRVLIDMFLADALDPGDDARLEAALARLGPDRVGLVTALNPDDKPYSRFARHASLIDARITPDPDGWHRRMGMANTWWGATPGAWLADGRSDPAVVNFDLRIVSSGYQRLSISELLASKQRLAGRLVIIGASPLVAPSRAMLPLNQAADRGGVMAVATQSIREGYGQRFQLGERANMGLQILAILLGFGAALMARSGRGMAILALSCCVALFSASVMLGTRLGVPAYPVRTLGGFMVIANVTLIQRLRIIPMMTSFFKGDMSPEEVWAWRSWETASYPALLFSANGRIKRSNQAAQDLVAEAGDRLPGLCLPRLGERASEITLADAGGEARSWQADWPDNHLPIVVLRDTSEVESARRALQIQLATDDLTGQSNRRGFDLALADVIVAEAGFAVFFIDMNGFKAINDTYGHDAGDELLVVSAARIAQCVRPGDTVARMGGDEFALIVRGLTDPARVSELAVLIEQAVSRPVRLNSCAQDVRVGAAVGFAIAPIGSELTDPVELLREADQAMYRAKRAAKKLRAA